MEIPESWFRFSGKSSNHTNLNVVEETIVVGSTNLNVVEETIDGGTNLNVVEETIDVD